MFVNEIKEDYGEEVLYEILKEYYSNYKYYNATTNDFIKISEKVTGDNFDKLVHEWLN